MAAHKRQLIKQAALSVAITMALCGNSAHAAPVINMTIEDVGNGGPGAYSTTLDGNSGAFKFGNIANTAGTIQYTNGTSFFTGDVAAAPGPAMGEIDTSVTNPTLTFSTGFIFAGSPFQPETLGPVVADISIVGGNPVLTITSLPWAGLFGGTTFDLPPQTQADYDSTCSSNTTQGAFEPLHVDWLVQVDATHYKYKIGWSHCITEAGTYQGQHAHWRLEGIATISTTSLSVSSTYPADTATSIPTNTKNYEVTYSEAMDATTVLQGSISIDHGVTVSANPTTVDNQTFVFPITALSASTHYTVTFNSGPKSATGTSLGATASKTFDTSTNSDSSAPALISVSPTSGATGVSPTATVTLTFSEAMNAASLNVDCSTGGFCLTGPGGAAVTGTMSAGSDFKTFTFFPSTQLSAGTSYSATVRNAVAKDDADNFLAASATNSWMFTIAGSGTTVVAEPPGNLGGGCSLNSKTDFDPSILSMLLVSAGYLGWRRRKRST